MTNKYTILQGDVLHRLGELPSESVHCVCTSPPYWGLRDYGTGKWEGGNPDCSHSVGGQVQDTKAPGAIATGQRPGVDASKCRKCGARRIDAQIGCEKTLDCGGWATGQKCGVCHVCVIVSVFREVRRVLRKDGTLWLNYGDCYATGGYSPHKTMRNPADFQGNASWTNREQGGQKTAIDGLKPKDLCMVPARVALALQADGWWLRSEIIWAKGNPMPESVTDRPTSAHEKIYLLSKSASYYYDADAVREKDSGKTGGRFGTYPDGVLRRDSERARPEATGHRNLRNVWNLNTEPYPAAHFATYPTAIPKRAILAGTSEKGVCPCCGAGWRREVNRVVGVSKECPKTQAAHEARGGTGKPVGTIGKSGGGRTDGYSETLGWQPSCTCGMTEDDLIPATVLDPFLGSGTTVAVALSLSRRGIGIELNAEYVKLAEDRIKPFAMQEVMTF